MKKSIVLTVVIVFFFGSVYFFTVDTRSVSKEKAERIGIFSKTLVAEALEQDYRRHNINISVVVTNASIDKITKEENREYLSYAVYGKVSYVIKGKRVWRDAEGNLIRLDPEGEITHWFSCEIFEDGYGELFKDRYRNHLVFYADKPAP